jgi:glutaminyl-tRNA synthetase
MSVEDSGPSNFIDEMVEGEVAAKKTSRVVTRFPPEPNGYLHIGHAKSICLNYGLAQKFKGTFHLRFDDTNPTKEELEYVQSIEEDVRWLGADWGKHLYFASDYFEKFYEIAEAMIQKGLAYVDSQTLEQIRENRGNFHKPGKDSPNRSRSVAENLDLFRRMRAGEFAEGTQVLRAKIDMAHKNINMRDPLMYRILKQAHHRTGDKWCIYPMYDYAHPLEDAIEDITHSICTLEFEDHRPLYDWFVQHSGIKTETRQIEFARLNLTYTVLSKRRLLELVTKKKVSGWDDPRMPTVSAYRRRGVTPDAIRQFCERIGVSKRDSVVDVTLFEHAIREDLNRTSPRVMAVLDPVKLVIENYPEGKEDWLEAPLHPEDPKYGSRQIPFGRELYVEREDYMDVAAKKWFRLAPGKEVRLRYAGLVTCREAIKDAAGNITELRCTWDPESLGGKSPDGRKVQGTLHWVSARHCVEATARLYDRLFQVENPNDVPEGKSFLDFLNPNSLVLRENVKAEPYLKSVPVGSRFQFERLGYFALDRDSNESRLVFNRTIGLRDTWAKIAGKQ